MRPGQFFKKWFFIPIHTYMGIGMITVKGENMKRKICALLLGFVFLFTAACGVFVKEDKIIKAVEKQGYSDVNVLDKDIFFVNWHGCSKGDDAHFDVIATNSRGKRVDLEVCAGWPFKGVTIRTQ